MIRDLTDKEIDAILHEQTYGHLGCFLSAKKPYVVPMTYAYDGQALYCMSSLGTKIEALRRFPSFCFQVERAREDVWESVMVWGEYEELPGNDAVTAASLLIERLHTERKPERSVAFIKWRSQLGEHGTKEAENMYFRLRILERTGKRMDFL